MKVALRNVRSPRKYTPMSSLSLCDDRGIVWGTIYVDNGSVSIRILEGVKVHQRVSESLGYWNLDKESDRSWRFRSGCPKCKDSAVIYDPMTYGVKCRGCGEVY